MSPEEFREYGRKAVDWIADYREQVESLPVLSRAEPGALRAALAARPARTWRAVRRRTARHGRARPARHHALAASVLLRLLPGQRERAGDPRRSARVRPRSAGHALGHFARGDRTRDARARLVRNAAGSARAIPLDRVGRWSHPAHRVGLGPRRTPRRAAPRQRRRDRTRRCRCRQVRRLHARRRRTRRSRRRAALRASARTPCARSTSILRPCR